MKEIRKIIAHYDSVDHSVEKLALASVVNVEASSYRRIGARMLVSSSGHWVGGISGGCLEGDALKRSQKAIFNNVPSIVVYDTLDDDENQIGIGLGCNGRIEVLFTPIDPNNPINPVEQLRQVDQSDDPSILLKVIASTDIKYPLGYSHLISQNDENLQFCEIEPQKIQQSIDEVRNAKRPLIKEFVSQNNGKLKILIEYIRPETQLIIVGDNYDVAALVGIAVELGWDCHIVGRKKKIDKKTYELCKSIREYEDFGQLKMDEYTAVVLMSHDYNWDKKILPQVIHQQLPYLGMLGPKKRMQKMQTELKMKSLDEFVHFYSPVGLDIGAESPEEIALSIAAEIVATFRKKTGKSLKFKEGTIHDR